MSGFIRHCEDNYIKFEQALRSRLRLPLRTNAPRRAKTKSVLQTFLHLQSKSMKRKPGRPKKAVQ